MLVRRLLGIAVLCLISVGLFVPVGAEPIDTWPVTHGFDCVGDSFNPIQPDGSRDPGGDPAPGSTDWIERDRQRRECTRQRDEDRAFQPPHANAWSVETYGQDWYREPAVRSDLNNVRFRYATPSVSGIPALELYRPCPTDTNTCSNLPEGLQRFDPPYPVVIVAHGLIANKAHHRYNAQVYAEAGYLAIVFNRQHSQSGPQAINNASAGTIIDWLASSASGIYGQEADLKRVAVAGHSQGADHALSFQGDPRVSAIMAWDINDNISANNCTGTSPVCAPIMYQRNDGEVTTNFSSAQAYAAARTSYPSGRDRGLSTYNTHKARGMDVMHLNLRATSHIDWNGNGVGLVGGNRLAEPVINYYALAWLDRHLKGKLVLSGSETPAEEAAERAYRQGLAEDAYDRLIAQKFVAGSIDKHNISMGFWDPESALASLDPLYGGNVPYTIEGLWTTDRLSTDYRSYCSVSVPNYTITGSGAPSVIARADSGGASGSGPANDMRIHSCPEVFRY